MTSFSADQDTDTRCSEAARSYEPERALDTIAAELSRSHVVQRFIITLAPEPTSAARPIAHDLVQDRLLSGIGSARFDVDKVAGGSSACAWAGSWLRQGRSFLAGELARKVAELPRPLHPVPDSPAPEPTAGEVPLAEMAEEFFLHARKAQRGNLANQDITAKALAFGLQLKPLLRPRLSDPKRRSEIIAFIQGGGAASVLAMMSSPSARRTSHNRNWMADAVHDMLLEHGRGDLNELEAAGPAVVTTLMTAAAAPRIHPIHSVQACLVHDLERAAGASQRSAGRIVKAWVEVVTDVVDRGSEREKSTRQRACDWARWIEIHLCVPRWCSRDEDFLATPESLSDWLESRRLLAEAAWQRSA